MKTVSLRTQKILMFIPLVNFSVLFIWLFLNSRQFPRKERIKANLCAVFGSAFTLVILAVAEWLFKRIFGGIPSYYGFMSGYLFSVAAAGILIWYQDRNKDKIESHLSQRESLFSKPKYLIVLAVFMVVCFSFLWFLAEPGKPFKDQDGNEINYTALSREELKNTSGASRGSFSKDHISGERSGITDQQTRKIDYSFRHMKFSGYYAYETLLATFRKEGDPLDFTCSTTLTSGKMRLFLMAPDGEILYEFNGADNDHMSMATSMEGIYYIVVTAHSAKGEIELSRALS